MRNIAKLTLLLAIPATSAFSVSLPTPFKSLDTDKDGYVSLTEAKVDKKLQAAFINIDKDYDSKISDKEYKAYLKAAKTQKK